MKTKHLIPLVAGLGLLCACHGKMNTESGADTTKNDKAIVSGSPTADSAATENVVLHKSPAGDSIAIKKVPARRWRKADTVQPMRRLVQKADIHFKVKSVQQTAEQVAALTTDLKGTVVYQTINAAPLSRQDVKRGDDSIMRVTVSRPVAEMTVKIPPPYVEVFLLQVARLGIHIDSSHMKVTDKTYDYEATRGKLKNEAELAATLDKKPAEARSPRDILELKNSMVDEQVNNRRIADSAKTGIIALTFYENEVITRELLAGNNPSSYSESATHRIGASINEGWDVFVDFIALLIKGWVLVPLGLGVWLVVRYINKKKTITNIKANPEL